MISPVGYLLQRSEDAAVSVMWCVSKQTVRVVACCEPNLQHTHAFRDIGPNDDPYPVLADLCATVRRSMRSSFYRKGNP